MLHHLVHPPDQPHMEHASSPLSDQILEFCESDFFKETIQNSDNCSYEEQSLQAKNLSFPPHIINYTMPAAAATTTFDCGDGNFTIMFEEKAIENDVSTPLDFANLQQYSFSHQDDQFDLSLLQNQISLTTDRHIIPPYPHPNDQTDVVSMMGPMVCENEFLSMPPSKCMRLNNTSSPSPCFLDHPYLASRTAESCGIFDGNLSLSNEIQAHDHEIELCGDNDGIFCSDPLPHPYNSNDQLQVLGYNESRHLNNGGECCNPPLAPPEIAILESESFRVPNKLNSEERKEKIHRYMKKRNERNFTKKIKYACRKTLADSRPRVRGRFAKNEEFRDHHRNTCINIHEEATDEDVKSMNVVVKEEDHEKLDSSEIFAHISSLNSFRCHYPIRSWI